jgi:hypothetical protein
MRRYRNPGTWIVGAALLVVCGLGALGWHAFRERGAWLRVPPGKAHLCVEFEGGPYEENGLMLGLVIDLHLLEDRVRSGSAKEDIWSMTSSRPPTVFRRGYLQFTRNVGVGRASTAPVFEEFKRVGLRGEFRLRIAFVDERGEILHVDP